MKVAILSNIFPLNKMTEPSPLLCFRCKLVPVIAEVDRIVRPGGKFIVRDEPETLGEVESLLNSMHWEISKNQEGLLCAKKGKWRPDSYVAVS